MPSEGRWILSPLQRIALSHVPSQLVDSSFYMMTPSPNRARCVGHTFGHTLWISPK
jgi:hypothetical protein